MLTVINRAMRDPDRWVVRIAYRDSKGVVTNRVISPIRWTTRGTFRALCLGRQEPRQFMLRSIQAAELVAASTVIMGEVQGNERVSVDGVASNQIDQPQ